MYLHPVVAFLAEKSISPEEIPYSDLYSMFGCEYDSSEISEHVSYYTKLYNKGIFEHGVIDGDTLFLRNYIYPEEILHSLSNCPQLVVELTERCNLSCRYCIYGDLYKDFSNRKGTDMDARIATSMIDFMISQWASHNNQSPFEPRYIGFYGGEPLLQFKLLKELIQYTNKQKLDLNLPFDIKYTMTTNGLLIDKYIDFLVDYDIDVLISLDGDKADNSARVFPNGAESFDQVMTNLHYIKSKYPHYFQNRVSFNAVFNSNSDYERLRKFFESHAYRFRLSELNPQYDSNLGSTLSKRINSDTNYTFSDMELEEFDSCTCEIYSSMLDFTSPVQGKHAPTGTCIPFSRKIFLSAQGLLLPCETIPHKYALGSVTTSGKVDLNFSKCSEYYTLIYKRQAVICKECYRINNCRLCVFLHKTDMSDSCPQYTTLDGFKHYLVRFIEHYEHRNGQ